ncbi:LOW QUALITY PROTEIN: hypothetical protein RJ639_034732 [Escallonia herrerae]|uniref:Uncharacterized protein n=1 Tax=Escallonia herrerae TaxID=1293975 RepID=A0AA88WXB3_9ASTE|nr:LOW QUALITY PROTEIN: hypothetical protein RJ639_034732 [Escallonia herrerae]
MEGPPPSASGGGVVGGANQSQLPPPMTKNKKRKLPSPRELIAHYESQGMETQDASIKVIEDLQNAVFSRRQSQWQQQQEAGRRDAAPVSEAGCDQRRLVNLEMKVDSKPGYAQTLAIGVASGALLRGVGSVIPHVAGALAQIWNSVRTATNST